MKKVLVLFADGFEEIEALTPVDFLRRAKVQVTTCGIGKKTATSSRNVQIITDSTIADEKTNDFDAIVIPGGIPGAPNIANCNDAKVLAEKLNIEGKIVAAICASPSVVLATWGLLDGRNAVCYPGMETQNPLICWKQDHVCVDKNIITARGAGCAVEFALELVKALVSEECAQTIAKGIVLY